MTEVLTPAARLVAAEAASTAARERIAGTICELQERLNPREMARSAARDAIDAGTAAAQVGADTVRRNPGIVAGAVTLAGLFLARRQIVALIPGRKPVLPATAMRVSPTALPAPSKQKDYR